MVGRAGIPLDFARGKFFVRRLQRLRFPRFAQGRYDWRLRIGDWGFAAARAWNVKRTQFARGPGGAGKSEILSSKS